MLIMDCFEKKNELIVEQTLSAITCLTLTSVVLVSLLLTLNLFHTLF